MLNCWRSERWPPNIDISRGVSQSNIVSSKLFTVVLEAHFNDLNWIREISTDGERLTHLLFADDCTVVAQNIQELLTNVDQLHEASVKVGLGINFSDAQSTPQQR